MTQSRLKVMLLLALALFVSLAVGTARAQTASTEQIPNHPALSDRFAFQLGAFYATTTTQASLAPAGGGAAVAIDFESALGLEDHAVVGIGGFLWRISERWRLEVEYFKLNRDASRTLETEVRWGDQVYPVGTMVNSTYDFSDTRVSAGYSFFKRRDKELGVGLGLHMSKIDVSLQQAGSSAEQADVTAPLPVVSFYGTFALTNQWAMRIRSDWLSLNYGDYSGGLRSSAMDVLYQPFRNVGFGFGMRSLMLDVTIDKSNWSGEAKAAFWGPAAYVTVSF